MRKIDIKQAVLGGQLVTFSFYRDGSLFYKTAHGDEFEITAEEAKGGTFNCVEKAVNLMRWMRKHNERIEAGESN